MPRKSITKSPHRQIAKSPDRQTILCWAGSLLLGVCALAFAGTLMRQVREMTGELDQAKYRQGVTGVMQAVQRDRRLVASGGVLGEMARGGVPRINPMAVAGQDPGNGLYKYLLLLVQLRKADDVSASQPGATDDQIVAAMHSVLTAPRIHLYLTRQRSLAESALSEAGFSQRESAALAKGLVSRGHLRVMRELVRRLMAKGRSWTEAGRDEDARASFHCAARVLLDLVADSPTPDAVLFASAELPEVLRALGHADAADQAAALRLRWHEAIGDDDVNLLPRTGDVVLAAAEQNRVLSSMLASGVLSVTWATLAVTCLAPVILLAWRRSRTHSGFDWQFGTWGPWAAGSAALLPALLLLVMIAGFDMPFVWLLSMPTLPALSAIPPVLVLTLLAATRWFIRPASENASACLSSTAAAVFVGVVAAVAMIGMIALPTHGESWRPPHGIQLIRQLGVWVGVLSAILIMVWPVWAELRRRGAGAGWGLGARAMLHAASAAWLICSVLLVVSLGLNARFDRQHGRAFAEASMTPLDQVLGADWRDRYFEGAMRVAG